MWLGKPDASVLSGDSNPDGSIGVAAPLCCWSKRVNLRAKIVDPFKCSIEEPAMSRSLLNEAV
jgi:hypothetical protein